MFRKKNHAILIPSVFSVALRKNPLVTADHVTTCDNELLTRVG